MFFVHNIYNKLQFIYVINKRCKFPLKCSSYLNYTKINANDELNLIGTCLSRCDGISLTFEFYLYMLNFTTNNWIPFTDQSFFLKSAESESNLIVLKELFKLYSRQNVWKIELSTTLVTYTNQTLNCDTSIIFFVNHPPFNGSCDIEPKNGTSNDIFTIFCDQWSDYEGNVASYSYYGNKY